MRTCTKCSARLPARFYRVAAGRIATRCTPCQNTERRLREPLAPSRPDPLQVRINNTFNLWHHPVGSVLLRSIA